MGPALWGISLRDVDWTAVAAVATAAAAGVTAWMAWMTRKMALHAEAQASTARNAFESAQRPIIVTTARTARLPRGDEGISVPTISQRQRTFVVPVRNIGAGAALNVHGVIMWSLAGEEDGEERRVTTTICVSPHPLQLGPGTEGDLEFESLTDEPISAPELLLRLWYSSSSDERYWTAEHLSSHVQGYRSVTGRWPMPTDIEEPGAVPDQFSQHLAQLRREALAERFGSRAPRDAAR